MVRHLAADCNALAKTGIDCVTAKPAQIAPLDWRKLRRFISSPLKTAFGAGLSYAPDGAPRFGED